MFSVIIPIVLLAATITTGNAYSKSTVVNKVEGQEVYTRIEVEANGEKKILESNQSGKHEVEVKSSGSSSAQATVKSTIIATSSSENTSINTKIRSLLGSIVKMISKIFRLTP